jgi:hypothetical protein
MNWEDLIFTILGGFIAGVSGILVAWYNEKKRRETEHLQDIKQRCLQPVLRELQDLKEWLMIGEARPLHWVCEQLESEPRWWEDYSLREVAGADPLLYEDLKNHYQDIYQELEDIEAWVRTKYPDYLLAVCKLFEKMSGDPELKEFRAELVRMNAVDGVFFMRGDFPQNVILFLILDVDKDLWPKIYSGVKPVMDKAIRLKEKFYIVSEAQRAREEMHTITPMIDNCMDKIKKAIHQTKLHGKCGYV